MKRLRHHEMRSRDTGLQVSPDPLDPHLEVVVGSPYTYPRRFCPGSLTKQVRPTLIRDGIKPTTRPDDPPGAPRTDTFFDHQRFDASPRLVGRDLASRLGSIHLSRLFELAPGQSAAGVLIGLHGQNFACRFVGNPLKHQLLIVHCGQNRAIRFIQTEMEARHPILEETALILNSNEAPVNAFNANHVRKSTPCFRICCHL